MYGVKLSQNYSKKYLQKRTEKQNKVIKKQPVVNSKNYFLIT